MKRVIRFTASWCQPCKALENMLNAIQPQMPIEVYDIDEHSEIASDFGIRGVPTLVMLEGNNEIKRKAGFKSKEEVENWLND